MSNSFRKRSGDIHKFSQKLLHNRFVLYSIFVIALGYLFHLVFSNNLMSVGVFFTTGLLTSFFSKNMVVIMVIALIVTNITRIGSSHKDGFNDADADEEDDDENDDREAFQDEDDDDEEEGDDREAFKGKKKKKKKPKKKKKKKVVVEEEDEEVVNEEEQQEEEEAEPVDEDED